MTNVTKFPGPRDRRKRKNLREGRVECEVSGRWLQFPSHASEIGGQSWLAVDVMTQNEDGKERKLCELVLDKGTLLAMLNQIPTKED